MEDNDKDLTQANLVDDLIQSLYGFSDEQLLKEFEEAQRDTTADPNIQIYPDEFDRIWEDICAERASRADKPAQESEIEEKPARKKKLSWKKVTVLALAAVLMTASICFVAVGKKSYFYRMKDRGGLNSNIVFNNDTNTMVLDDQESAYGLIENELKIKPLRLGYIPEGMVFDQLEMNERNAIMKFIYNGEIVYFVQATDQTEASSNHNTDGQNLEKVRNIRLGKDILIKKEEGDNGRELLETQFTFKDSFCWLYGVVDEKEFIKIVESIIY